MATAAVGRGGYEGRNGRRRRAPGDLYDPRVQIELPRGVRVGHHTDLEAWTGCTVVLLPEGTVAAAEVRGGGPGTRESALLDPAMTVERIDAVTLAGGSAFGLDAASGVQAWLRERRVLELRYGVLGEVPHSVAQTSKALKLTPHRIRALEEEALRRLRHLPEAQGLREAA